MAHTTRRLSASSSLVLDVVRFGAALVVAFGHVTQHYFSKGWRDFTGHAVEAVGVFFVLSGFVIRENGSFLRPLLFAHLLICLCISTSIQSKRGPGNLDTVDRADQ